MVSLDLGRLVRCYPKDGTFVLVLTVVGRGKDSDAAGLALDSIPAVEAIPIFLLLMRPDQCLQILRLE